MKKLISMIAVAAVCVAGLFAVDFGAFPKGTWKDAKWNANWEFGADSLKLKDSNTDELIFDFAGKMSNFRLTPSTEGISISFKCAETERAYKFTKPATGDTSIIMEIDPDWTTENYKVTMPFQAPDVKGDAEKAANEAANAAADAASNALNSAFGN